MQFDSSPGIVSSVIGGSASPNSACDSAAIASRTRGSSAAKLGAAASACANSGKNARSAVR